MEGETCTQIKEEPLWAQASTPTWYLKFDKFMSSKGYTRCHADHCCLFKVFDGSYIIFLLYADDMLVARSSMKEIKNLKKQLFEEFEIKDLGATNQIHGTRISKDRKSQMLKLSQAEYIQKVLNRFNMQDTKPVSTPLAGHFRLTQE